MKTVRVLLFIDICIQPNLVLITLNQLKADRNNTLNNFDEAEKIYINRKAKLLYTKSTLDRSGIFSILHFDAWIFPC